MRKRLRVNVLNTVGAKLDKKSTKCHYYEPCESIDVCKYLKPLDYIHIRRYKLIIHNSIRTRKGSLCLYRITSKPIYLENGGNWKFKAATRAKFVTSVRSSDTKEIFEETFYVNELNISDFLFDRDIVADYREGAKIEEALLKRRLREKEEWKNRKRHWKAVPVKNLPPKKEKMSNYCLAYAIKNSRRKSF